MKFVSFGLAVVLSSGKRLAKVRTDAVFTAPCETSILYPSSGGNMHCFTAKTACAVLDVLGPPYSIPERHCTYYYDHAYAKYAGIFLLWFLIRKGIDTFIFRNVFYITWNVGEFSIRQAIALEVAKSFQENFIKYLL